MITLLFVMTLVAVVLKLIGLAFKATWGIAKVIASIVVFPLTLVVMVCTGLIGIAFPILIVVGIVLVIKSVAVGA